MESDESDESDDGGDGRRILAVVEDEEGAILTSAVLGRL